MKDAPLRIDIAIAAGHFQEAARIVSTSSEGKLIFFKNIVSGELLEGRLSIIEGIAHLRTTLNSSAATLATCIVDQVVKMLVVDPFEQHVC